MNRETKWTRRYEEYEMRRELVSIYDEESIELTSYYTHDGYYIGNAKTANYLTRKRGIKPELANPGHTVCSIGFCEAEQKWYGWSHRAIAGFGIGDMVDSEDHSCACSGWTDEYLAEHPEADIRLPVGFTARTLEDARHMALVFAESVS
jgi:hypothetical protein